MSDVPTSRPAGEHSTIAGRATPLGTRAVRAQKGPSLRLFGVAAREEHPAQAGERPPGIDTVTFRDLAAIVTPAPYTNEALTPRELEAHVSTVAEVFALRAIVPAPPGTVFRSPARLLTWLELHYYTLSEALEYVTDRVVARVTVRRGDPDALVTAAAATPSATLRLTPAADDPPGAPGDLVSVAAETFRELRRDATALIILRADPASALSDESAHGSFLIDRSRWRAFEDAVAQQSRRHAALRLECTGPWPPYDFVRMQFKA